MIPYPLCLQSQCAYACGDRFRANITSLPQVIEVGMGRKGHGPRANVDPSADSTSGDACRSKSGLLDRQCHVLKKAATSRTSRASWAV